MNISRKNIYIISAIIGLSIGAIIGRYVYINNVEEEEGVRNYTPDVEKAITNGE
jgi:hypothetical protein